MPMPVRSIHISQDPERARGTRIHTHSVVTSAAATGSERKTQPGASSRLARLAFRLSQAGARGPTAPHVRSRPLPLWSWLGRDPGAGAQIPGLEGRGGAGRDDRGRGRAGGAGRTGQMGAVLPDLPREQQHLPTPKPHFVAELKPKLYGLETDCTERTLRSQRRRGIKRIKHALPLLWVQRDGKEAVSGCSGWRL